MKKASILLPWESYIFLINKQNMERLGKALSERSIEILKRNFERHYPSGYMRSVDEDFGGSRNGKWTWWSCERVRMILIQNHLSYHDGGEVNVIGF